MSELGEDRFGVYVLDVGQGDCTFLVPPRSEEHANPILFDCADPYVAERFVANHGIEVLDAVVASHLDADHVRGMLPFLRHHFSAGRKVNKLVIGLDRAALPGADESLTALLDYARSLEANPPHPGFGLHPPFRGPMPMRLSEGRGWAVDLVLPWYGRTMSDLAHRRRRANANSAVLRVECHGVAILVTGDAPLGALEELERPLQRANVLRVPHHAGGVLEDGESWDELGAFYSESVVPEVGMISVGTRNGHGHPNTEHLVQLGRSECRIMCTQLTPRCHQDPSGLRESFIERAAGVEWPYRHRAQRGHRRRRPDGETPCAGSMVAWVERDGRLVVEPSPLDHAEMLDRVDEAWCRKASSSRSTEAI